MDMCRKVSKKLTKFTWKIIEKGGTKHGFVAPVQTSYVSSDTTTFRSFSRALSPDYLVLEIGCSNGFCTQQILKRVANGERIVAVDISSSFIEECQRKFPTIQNIIKVDVLFDWKLVLDAVNSVTARFAHENSSKLAVFVDIGGNRELETLAALLPAIENDLQPVNIFVKSETLYHIGKQHGLDDIGWEAIRSLALDALKERRPKQKSQTRAYHPLKMPLRLNASGIAICRYHNYDVQKGCLKYSDRKGHGERCELDHEHCHSCGKPGHRAFECTEKEKDEPLIENLFKNDFQLT